MDHLSMLDAVEKISISASTFEGAQNWVKFNVDKQEKRGHKIIGVYGPAAADINGHGAVRFNAAIEWECEKCPVVPDDETGELKEVIVFSGTLINCSFTEVVKLAGGSGGA